MTDQVAFLPAVLRDRLKITGSRIEAFCQQWKIQELALFGSVVRDDFNNDSDIDVLIELEPTANIGLFDIVRMKEELSALFNRPVDLTQKRLVKNPFSRAEILRTCRVIYPLENANFTGLIAANKIKTENVRDSAALFDMSKAMQAISSFVLDKTLEDYLTDDMLQCAIERQLGVLGRAADRISYSLQSQHTEVDWRNIAGFRNVIVRYHEEFDYEKIWNIATRDMPELLQKIQSLIPELPIESELTDG